MAILDEFGEHMCEVCGTDCVEAERQLDSSLQDIKKLKNVPEAARRIRHWHDAMKDNSSMVVSAEAVRNLWFAIAQYDGYPKGVL
jgi:hypothetical protein